MTQNNEAYARIRQEYDTKYLRAQQAADARRAEIHSLIPEIAEIDRALGQTGLKLMASTMRGDNVEKSIQTMRAQNEELRHVRAELLIVHGYPADYTEIKYECPLCGDTGFVDTKMCGCFRKKLLQATYETSGLGHLLSNQTFENFKLEYYQDNTENYRIMGTNLKRLKIYADTFEPEKSHSILLMGGTGLGKTHLCSAIAKKVIDSGYDVLYVSAIDLFADFEKERFGNSAAEGTGTDMRRYTHCDLLIIDDLGTEVINKFTTSTLYNIINTRLIHRKATILNTNFTVEEFQKQYWDRITSRVFTEYICMHFVGSDIRAQKLNRR